MHPLKLVVLASSLLICVSSARAVVRVVERSPDRVTLDVFFPRAEIVMTDRRGAFSISVADAQVEMPVGFPALPTHREVLAVPPGTAPYLRILSKRQKRFRKRGELEHVDGTRGHCPVPPREKNVTAYEAEYGKSLVEIAEDSFAGPDRIVTLKFWPVRYSNRARFWTFTSRMRIRIDFKATRKTYAAPVPHGRGVAAYVVLNPEHATRATRGGFPTELVIAHKKHEAALKPLLDYKRSLGRLVRDIYLEKSTTAQIQALIRGQYAQADPPTSTLLVGNIDDIPAWRGTGDNRWTDFNYTLLDAGDVPDISLGRIPALNADELTRLIQKIRAREENIRDEGHILLTAGQDESLGCPASVSKVGDNLKPAGEDVRIVKRYRTEVGTEAVFQAYNNNPNIVVYDGHGDRQGMQEIPLLISNLPQLTNAIFPLILDIACLNANWLSKATPRNFAETILLQQNRGAAGIMASGGSGYGHDFFQTIGSVMTTARQNLFMDPSLNEIGRVILAAKIRHGAEDRTYWNYYGDPTSSVWESTMIPH